MKAQTAKDRACQPVVARAIDRPLPDRERPGDGQDVSDLAEQAEVERRQKDQRIGGNQNGDGGEEADQKFQRGAVIFQRLAGDLAVRPQKAAGVGGEPEAVDAERDPEQDGAANLDARVGLARAQESHLFDGRARLAHGEEA